MEKVWVKIPKLRISPEDSNNRARILGMSAEEGFEAMRFLDYIKPRVNSPEEMVEALCIELENDNALAFKAMAVLCTVELSGITPKMPPAGSKMLNVDDLDGLPDEEKVELAKALTRVLKDLNDSIAGGGYGH